MNPVIVTAPASYPITIDDVKSSLQIETGEFDARLTAFVAAATAFVENYTGRALITRTYKGFMDHWASHPYWNGLGLPYWRAGAQVRTNTPTSSAVHLPMAPLQSVAHVITYDDSDVPTTMDPATYYVDTASAPGRIVRRTNVSWPDPARAANGIEIQWTAGYGDEADDVPANFKHAMMLLVSHWNEHPDAVVGVEGRDSSAELPLGVSDLLAPFRIYGFA